MPWDLTGNPNINQDNFLGPRNNQPLRIRTNANANGNNAMTITAAPDANATGNVGIGTTNPQAKLSVVASGASELRGTALSSMLLTSAGSLSPTAGSELALASIGFHSGNNTSLGIRALRVSNGGDWNTTAIGLGIDVDNTVRAGGASLWLHANGGVGIGTQTPGAKLSVNGDIEVTGDIRLSNADCAEDFEVSGDEEIEPGTVMVIDEAGALKQSEQAYDKRVAGVISGAGEYRSAIILDKLESEADRMPVALVGKVACKVDARYSPIEVGDLLTTSPTPGQAMKADDPLKAPGAVLGKALQRLTEGQGILRVLVALQ